MTGGPGCHGVTAAVAPTELDRLETEVVPDFVVLRMEHRPVAIPDFSAGRAFALDDDFAKRGERAVEAVDHDDASVAPVRDRVGNLPLRVTAEDVGLTKARTEVTHSVLDRVVELSDGLVAVALRIRVRCRRLLDLQKELEGFGTEREQRDLERRVRVRERTWVGRKHPRRVDSWASTHCIQQVRGQKEVQHLFDKDAAHDFDDLWVAIRIKRVQRAQVRRQCRVFELDRPLQMFSKICERRDTRARWTDGWAQPDRSASAVDHDDRWLQFGHDVPRSARGE